MLPTAVATTLTILLLSWISVSLSESRKPNIVWILTDDQDITIDGMKIMDKTNKLIVDQGITFKNAFVHSPICCISRSSYLSGRYVHNNHCTGNSIASNCSSPWWQQNIEPTCFAAYIEKAGYQTFYAGKYLNTYGAQKAGGVAHIPNGWTHWYGLVGNSRYYNYQISNNGVEQSFGHNYTHDYYTDIIRSQAMAFLNDYYKNYSDNLSSAPPFLIVMATPSAHAPFTPAPQYNETYQDITAPRTPNWNNVAVNKNKHQLMQIVPQMNANIIAQTDQIFRYRAGTLRSVDDMINDVHNSIRQYPEIFNNTYFLYTSDHGFHSGQFGMGFDKRQLYENDIRIPFYMSGPGIKGGSVSDTIVLNVDIAPTLVELATGSVPEIYDGRSFVPYLKDSDKDSLSASTQQQFLIEYYGEGGANPVCCGNGIPGFECQLCDSQNNTYRCARVINGTNNEVNGTIFCNFLCYDSKGDNEVECEKGTPQGDGEYYDLENDYFELDNVMNTLSADVKNGYNNMIDSFMTCSGQTECNKLREGVQT